MKKIKVTDENSGNRIDKFLMSSFASSAAKAMADKKATADKEEVFFHALTRGEIIKSIKAGDILVDGKIMKPSYILKEGEEIRIDIKKEKEEIIPNKDIKLEIIHEDKNIIVVNKTAGISVHPNDVEKENTLVNALVVKWPEIKDVYPHTNEYGKGKFTKYASGKNKDEISEKHGNIGVGVNDGSEESWMRPGIVHRLDKDTSGAIVVAKNMKAFEELKRMFADRKVEKNYVAIVHGHLEKNSGVVDQPIARSASFKKQKIARGKIKGTSRAAVTEYKLLERYDDFDMVEALPKTGRMHQIRVHLSFLGNPIVGDEKYRRKNLMRQIGVKRQLLHAQKLEFELFGKKYSFQAPLPEDFESFLLSIDPALTLKGKEK
ncbi:MAG TPA: hypothetical protein DIT25_02425 [Candidatus Moranbacteria bacterium]|nr:hypothetical protein [Candidatus Moranbacteria bacterium]